LQTPAPGKLAATSVRSLEVQEDAGGNVCEKPFEKNSTAGSKRNNIFIIPVRVLKGVLIAEVFKIFKTIVTVNLIVYKMGSMVV